MIYTPSELKTMANKQEVQSFLETDFDNFISDDGGFLDIPEEWDAEMITLAVEILKQYNWETIVDQSTSTVSGEDITPKARLALIPMITMTQDEYNMIEIAKTAIMSEVVQPNVEEMKVTMVKDSEEEYPPFEVDQEEQVG